MMRTMRPSASSKTWKVLAARAGSAAVKAVLAPHGPNCAVAAPPVPTVTLIPRPVVELLAEPSTQAPTVVPELFAATVGRQILTTGGEMGRALLHSPRAGEGDLDVGGRGLAAVRALDHVHRARRQRDGLLRGDRGAAEVCDSSISYALLAN